MWLETAYGVFAQARSIKISPFNLADLGPALRLHWESLSHADRLRWNSLAAAIRSAQQAQVPGATPGDLLNIFVGRDPIAPVTSEPGKRERDTQSTSSDRDEDHAMSVDEDEDDSSVDDSVEVSNVVQVTPEPVAKTSRAKKAKARKDKPMTKAARAKVFNPSIHMPRPSPVSFL
jgi:hypothetical protein